MKINEAIALADNLRLNTISDEQKYTWVYEFECSVAEMMGVAAPEKNFPEDIKLMMPSAHEDVYVKYLVAKIDYYTMDGEIYANDMSVFEKAWAEARAWYIRNHGAKNKGNWRAF